MPVGVQEPAPGRPSYSMEVWGETDYGLRGGQGERAEKLDAEDRLIARLGCYSLVALAVVIALVWAIHGGLL